MDESEISDDSNKTETLGFRVLQNRLLVYRKALGSHYPGQNYD